MSGSGNLPGGGTLAAESRPPDVIEDPVLLAAAEADVRRCKRWLLPVTGLVMLIGTIPLLVAGLLLWLMFRPGGHFTSAFSLLIASLVSAGPAVVAGGYRSYYRFGGVGYLLDSSSHNIWWPT